MSDLEIPLVLAVTGFLACVLYAKRLQICEWLAAELLSYADGVRARGAARSHWREHLRTQPKILELRVRS